MDSQFGLNDDPSGLPLLGTMKWKQKWVPPPFESLISSFGTQNCLPNRIYTLYAAAEYPTQTFILNHGKHPRSYEKVSSQHLPRDTYRISNFIFKFSSIRYQGAPCKEITIKLFNPPRTSEIFMLASQTSMLVHTHFLFFDLSTIHLPHHGTYRVNSWDLCIHRL